MLYSFIFFHTTIQVNDPEASLSNMSNTINKTPFKNTTQTGTNHKILLNSFLYTNPNIYYLFFYQKYIFIVILFPNLYNTKYDENTLIQVLYNTHNTGIFFCTSIVDNTRIRVLLSPSSNDPFIFILIFVVPHQNDVATTKIMK